MGWHLRTHYADDLVIVAFDFYQGGFRAVTQTSSGGHTGLANHTVGPAPAGSYEYYFHSAGMERMVLDTRNVNMETASTSWLAGPHLMRSIDAAFMPSNPNAYLYPVSLPSLYDIVVYFDNTSAAVGLPFIPPNVW